MKKIIVMLAVLAVIVTAAVLPTSAAQNYCVAFEEKMNDFVLFNLTPLGEEFNAKTVIVYTYSKLDMEDYGVGEENEWGYHDKYSVPAAEFERKAASLFGNVDSDMISRMHSAQYEDIGMYGYTGTAYDSATDSYIFYPSDGFGTSRGYVIFGYTQGSSSYTGYFYFVDTYYERADGDSLNVDYIINPNFTGTDDMYYELLAKVKVVFEYSGSGEIKLISIAETDNFIASGLILPTTDPDDIPEPGSSSEQSSSSPSQTPSSQPGNTSSGTPGTSSSEVTSSKTQSTAPQPTESSSEAATSSEAPPVSSETGSADETVSENSSSGLTSSSGTSTESPSSGTESTEKTTGASKSDKKDSDGSDENSEGNSVVVTVVIIVAAIVLLGGGGLAGYMFAIKKANRH